MSAHLETVRAIRAEARTPGEISGPALALTIRITNNGSRSIDLGAAVVNLTDADDKPGLPISGSPASPLRGMLAPRRSATATYVFTVPTDKRAPISVTVSYLASAPVVLFVGNAS